MLNVNGLVHTVTAQTNPPYILHQLSSIDLTIHGRNFTLGSIDIASTFARSVIPVYHAGSWSST